MAGTHVALLRGINVGRAKRVAMADLRTVVTDLGYSDVRTLLNSGNVVFTAPRVSAAKAAKAIEEAVGERLGVASRATVLTGAEVASAVADNPLSDVATDPSRLLVAVLARAQDRKRLMPMLKQDWAPEVLAVGERVAYMWLPDGMRAARLPEAVGRALGDAVTTRNWATITKLHGLIVGVHDR